MKLRAALLLLVATGCSSSVLPSEYKYLSPGMPFEEAVEKLVTDDKHAGRYLQIGGGIDLNAPLPADAPGAMKIIQAKEAEARSRFSQTKTGQGLASALASLDGHGFTTIQADPKESTPFQDVQVTFSKGKVYKIEIRYRGAGRTLKEDFSTQLRKKYGEPAKSEALGDEMETKVWYLCDQKLTYELEYLGPGPGAGPQLSHPLI
jgi:hypothetical protein